MEQIKSLCGLWRFQPDLTDEGEAQGYFRLDHDARRWREVTLPASFEACMPALDTYEGVGWFRRLVDVPADWQGRRVSLRFQGVNDRASVWVNGVHLGDHEGGFLPFEWDVQDLLRWGQDNLVVVCADNRRRPGDVPGLQRGWRGWGGILREVELVATDLLYLEHVRMVAEPVDQGGRLVAQVQVKNGRPQVAAVQLQVRLMMQDEILTCLTSEARACPSGESLSLTVDGLVENIKLWSPEQPNLYTAQVELWTGGNLADAQSIRVGFRRIEAREGGLYLNGSRLFLTGFNRHEDLPRTAMCPDPDIVRRDLADIKEAGANFVRLCHYPHHPAELDMCDEVGLLAMGEIPLYWWDGLAEGQVDCARKLDAAKQQLAAMIRRDANHPSVIMWSVSNETDEERPEVAAGNAELVRLAQQLDSTRLAVHVSNHWQGESRFEADDVICVNAYPGLERRSRQPDADLSLLAQFWRTELGKLHEKYPPKPILVSEFGSISLPGVWGGVLGEDTQAEILAGEFAGMDAPYVCGATVWCWADHPWPPATFDFCGRLAISPYGVMTRDRRKLRAYWTVRQMFRERQGVVEPPLPSALRESAAGYPVVMICPHLRDIPQVPFPPGFGIRPMRLDEGGLWTDIERDAEPFFSIGEDVFEREFGHDPQSILHRCYIVTDERGLGVGTISAWYNRDFKGQDYGRIHWVAVRRGCWGKGLGKAELSFAMNQLAQWHERAYLDTQTRRIPAIKMYLEFGFVPDLEPPGAVEAWRSVLAELKHPVLVEMLS